MANAAYPEPPQANKPLCPFLLSFFSPVLAGGEGEITWQKDGEDTDEDKVTKVDETSSKFHIKKVTMQDTGRYTCLCEFDNGHNDQVQYQLYVYGM